MSEDVPIYNGPTIVVTASDGTLFSCTPVYVGGVHAPRQIRWNLIAQDGMQYNGPEYSDDQSDEDVARMVVEWWDVRGELGWRGVNAQTLRDRLARDL